MVFLKLCTPTSGKTLNDKVIFLVFKKGEDKPFLCVKTVRSYGAREIIVKNFNNLKTLHNLVEDSQFADMFVTPCISMMMANLYLVLKLPVLVPKWFPMKKILKGLATTYSITRIPR